MEKKDPKPSIRLQGWMAVSSFTVGTALGSLCLFAVEPYGEISNSGLGLVSEFLVLAGALLGFNLSINHRIGEIKSEIMDTINKTSLNHG